MSDTLFLASEVPVDDIESSNTDDSQNTGKKPAILKLKYCESQLYVTGKRKRAASSTANRRT